MRFIGILSVVLMLATPLLTAAMTHEELCNAQGDVAFEAAKMRQAGDDQAVAIKTLTEQFEAKGAGLKSEAIGFIVKMAYMVKMKPEKTREYTISECRKDILK